VDKKNRFESKESALAFYTNARISPAACYALLKDYASEDGEAKDGYSVELGTYPKRIKEDGMWLDAPSIIYPMALAVVVHRRIKKSGSVLSNLKAIPLEDLLTEEEEEGTYPSSFRTNDGKVSVREYVAKYCTSVLVAITKATDAQK
jgi:hypothetical protein